MASRKSVVVARDLGVTYYRLIGLLRSGKITPPQKDSSGDYLWSPADVSSARGALGIDRRRKAHEAKEKAASPAV
jgi:hypothetical protein